MPDAHALLREVDPETPPALSQLHAELAARAELTAIFAGATFWSDQDILMLVFTDTPSAEQVTAADEVLAAHVPI